MVLSSVAVALAAVLGFFIEQSSNEGRRLAPEFAQPLIGIVRLTSDTYVLAFYLSGGYRREGLTHKLAVL